MIKNLESLIFLHYNHDLWNEYSIQEILDEHRHNKSSGQTIEVNNNDLEEDDAEEECIDMDDKEEIEDRDIPITNSKNIKRNTITNYDATTPILNHSQQTINKYFSFSSNTSSKNKSKSNIENGRNKKLKQNNNTIISNE